MVNYIHQFSKAAGLLLSIDKCENIALYDQPALSISNNVVRNQMKYLGRVVAKNKSVRESENIAKCIAKCETIRNSWLQSGMTTFERYYAAFTLNATSPGWRQHTH